MCFLGITVPLVLSELVLRMLPVNEGSLSLAVNEQSPVSRFPPNRNFVWSKRWNFEMVYEVRSNNFSFINNTDYSTTFSEPLLTLIGDSYLKAIMVPFQKTVTGRLGRVLDGTARVYSFGRSESPLSQYLAYAKYVNATFHPDGMVIVIVGNDFDESLMKYKSAPAAHYFVEDRRGAMRLELGDFTPKLLPRLLMKSALVRYLALNLELLPQLNRLVKRVTQEGEISNFVGNTSSSIDFVRVRDSRRAIDTFLDLLPMMPGLHSSQILFVIDGIRPNLYDDATLKVAQGSYFDLMRQYFIEKAVERNYEIVDMQPIFRRHYSQHGERFEYPHDGHWNALGHELCFEAITRSAFFSRFSIQSPSLMRN